MTLYAGFAVVVGLIVGFYWARVLKLVRKTRKKTGQSAQLLPREPLGRVLRVIWYPTVVVWVAHPWVSAGAVFAGIELPGVLRPLWTTPWALAAGAVVAAAALWGTLICWRKMGTSWRMGINPGEKTSLVVTGPYAFVAHPIYALQQVLVLASAAVVASPVMLGVAVIELVFLQWEARREEQHLVAVHGEVYRRYIQGVGRFVPRSLKPFSA